MRTHAPVQGSDRVILAGSRKIAPTNPQTEIEVTLKIRRKAPLPALTARPTQQMTRGELAAKHGADAADLATVSAVFKAEGFSVVSTSAAARTVKLSGPASLFEKVFLVTLTEYQHPDGAYRGRAGQVQVPAAVASLVEGVFGLDTRRVARRQKVAGRTPALAHGAAAIPATWYTPEELAQRYGFPASDGAGQTVGVLEFGGGYFPADLTQFCQLAGTTPPTVVAVSVDKTSTSARDGAEGEVMLDIEVIAGAAPGARVVVYFSPWTEQGWIDGLDTAMQDATNDPSVLSVSWGYAEDVDIWTAQALTQVNETLQEAAHLGITVCAAAGDDGSSAAITDGKAHVIFPGSSPYVLSVGGTTIESKASALPDAVWKEGTGLRSTGGGSTGGGVSSVFPRPAWQAAQAINSVNGTGFSGRSIPDLSANADWDASPYLLVVDGSAQGNGGTSAATPLLASLVARMNAVRGSRVGYLSPILYGQTAAGFTVGKLGCTDIVTGNNTTAVAGGYTADAGYDAVSGWGTPNGNALMALMPGGRGSLGQGGAAVAWGPGRLDAFSRSNDGGVVHKFFSNGWGPNGIGSHWEPLGPPPGGLDQAPPVAVAWASGRLDIFASGADGNVYHKFFSGNWGPGAIGAAWESLGGPVGGGQGSPSAVSWSIGRLDIFMYGADGNVYHKYFSSNWEPGDITAAWESIGRPPSTVVGSPSAVSWSDGRLDIFALASDGNVYHKFFSGNWGPIGITSPWESIGGLPGGAWIGSPSAVSWSAGRLDIFACGSDGNIYHKFFDANWGPKAISAPWESIGRAAAGTFEGSPSAVSWSPGRLDIFARSSDGNVYHKYFDGNWGPGNIFADWESIGGSPNTAAPFVDSPMPVSWSSGRLDIFAKGSDGNGYHKYFGGNWGPGSIAAAWELVGGVS